LRPIATPTSAASAPGVVTARHPSWRRSRPGACRASTSRSLCSGLVRAIDVGLADRLAQGGVRHPLQIGPTSSRPPSSMPSGRPRPRRSPRVAGDSLIGEPATGSPHACAASAGAGRSSRGAQQGQARRDVGEDQLVPAGLHDAEGERQRPLAIGRDRPHPRLHAPVEGAVEAAGALAAAARQHRLRRALHPDEGVAGMVMMEASPSSRCWASNGMTSRRREASASRCGSSPALEGEDRQCEARWGRRRTQARAVLRTNASLHSSAPRQR